MDARVIDTEVQFKSTLSAPSNMVRISYKNRLIENQFRTISLKKLS